MNTYSQQTERFDTIHHEYEIDGTEIDSLPEIIKYLGDPFVEGGLMVNYCVMKLIGDNKPDVILGGDGSDQYFGTSGREVALHYLANKYRVLPFLKFAYNGLNCNLFDNDTKLYRVRFHLDKIINILHGDLFGIPSFMLKKLVQDDKNLYKLNSITENCKSFEELYLQHKYESDIEKIINQVILFKASKMASMFDNNLTFPYMDNDLYDFIKDLPVNLKCKGDSALDIAKGNGVSKFLLKNHYKPLLPKEITDKKKQGGFAPMPIFFDDKIRRDRFKDFIMNSSISDNFLNKKTLLEFLDKYENEVNSKGDWFWYKQNKAIQFFNILTLTIWWEIFVEKKNVIL